MKRLLLFAATVAVALAAPRPAHAFCGFYVGKAGAELYNHASKVVMARDGNRTVLTMSNDFEGNMKDFALVVPVPTLLTKDQIHIGERKYIDRIDSYSAPRLVEYFDPNPCQIAYPATAAMGGAMRGALADAAPARLDDDRTKALGVKVEAQYSIGEYDIVILSAKQSDGLETYLKESGYQIPPRAAAALEPYIKQEMKFFVAKVNLKEQKATGMSYLRPIQIAYESEKFMLPIRLGMANARGEQDLLVYTLTRKGRVESANYKTINVPSDVEVPEYVQKEFGKFYGAVFEKAHKKADYRAVHTEYVWNAGSCDPCVDSPLTAEEMRGLGVFWLDGKEQSYHGYYAGGTAEVTRLHVRYDAEHFPEDLVFQETGDMATFQARYILRHPFRGSLECAGGEQYRKQLDQRHTQELETLASLTGWSRDTIIKHMGNDAPGASGGTMPWYKKLWQ